jgi:hypothetical protein
LVRGAVGDYADEAAVLLVINSGHWLPQLQLADLLAVVPDDESEGYGRRSHGRTSSRHYPPAAFVGASCQVRLLRAASSIAEGHPVVLGDLAAGLDRPALTLLLAAIAHAEGSHDQREPMCAVEGVQHRGRLFPPLVPWPLIG